MNNNSTNPEWQVIDRNDNLKIKLDKLYHNLNITTKELTCFDLYRITDVVDDANDFYTKANDLSPFASLITSVNGTYNDTTYSIGDIFYKTTDNQIHHIPAERSGIFFPSKIENKGDNVYTISYSVSSQAVKEGSVTLSNQNLTAPKETISYDFNPSYVNSPYNFVYIQPDNGWTDPVIFASAIVDAKTVTPIIKAFNSNNEEIYNGVSISFNDDDNQWSLNVNSIVEKVLVK